MNTKFYNGIFSLLVGFLTLAGAGSARAADEFPKMIIRAANDINAEHPTNRAMVRWKELLAKATNGKIQMQVFPNAVLGSTDSQMTQLQEGSIDVVVLGGISLLGKYNDQANIELLPYMFKSNEAAMRALDGAYGTWLQDKIAGPAGFKVMSYMLNGMRDVGNTKRPIIKPADMEGLKFRVANVALLIEFFKQMGATAVPIAFPEVFTALQQGTIDGFENPPAVFNSNHFDEVTKYLSLTEHAFTAYVPVMNLKKFNAYSPNVQKVLIDTAKEAAIYQRTLMYQYESQSIADLTKRGMKINKVDKAAFLKAVQPIWDRFIAKYGREGIDLALQSQK